jgi:hypothetical protein
MLVIHSLVQGKKGEHWRRMLKLPGKQDVPVHYDTRKWHEMYYFN